MDAMTAINKSVPLFDGFVKVTVGLVAFIYFFGIFWYPNIKYAVIDIVLILGLCFRLFFVINNELPKWKIGMTCFFYIAVIIDQIYDLVISSGSLEKILNSSSTIVIVALFAVFCLDAWQYRKTHSGVSNFVSE
jgi:hypothetical protein